LKHSNYSELYNPQPDLFFFSGSSNTHHTPHIQTAFSCCKARIFGILLSMYLADTHACCYIDIL